MGPSLRSANYSIVTCAVLWACFPGGRKGMLVNVKKPATAGWLLRALSVKAGVQSPMEFSGFGVFA